MDARTLLLLAVALVVSGCGSYGSNPPTDTSAPTDVNTNSTNTVTYTGSGFQPSTITIEKGETVTWVSNAGRFWIASDSHPSHAAYDGTIRSQHCSSGSNPFDQCSSGTQYSFTFEKTGTWNYHNHLTPREGGTVIVK